MSDNFQDVALDTIKPHANSVDSAEASQTTASASPASQPTDDSSYTLMMTAVRAAIDRKGGNVVALHVAEVSFVTDYFVMVTGFSRVQVRAIAQSIDAEIEDTLGRMPLHKEGMSDGSWVLLDYGETIVHVFLPDEREFYNLEAFWGHADRVEIPAEMFEAPSL
jgi:ribosome-associated protein